jgi:long-chain fatty acid transport protein
MIGQGDLFIKARKWHRNVLLFFCIVIATSLSWHPQTTFASGPIHGAKGAGMGTAFSAVADDPSAVSSNPAGIAQLEGTNIYGGASFVIPSTSFESISGQKEDTAFQVFFPPHIYISSDMGQKDLKIGLGIFSPFGIGGRRWSREGLTRYMATKDQILTLVINPVLAYRVSPRLSVAAGVDYMYSRHEAEKMIDQSFVGAPDGKAAIKADGGGWGFNGGVLFDAGKGVTLGLAYRSRIRVDHKGEMKIKRIAPQLQPLFGGPEFSSDIRSRMTFPDVITIGAAFRPSERVVLSFEAEDVRWSSFKNAEVRVADEVPEAGVTSGSNPLNWRNLWTIKAGMEYAATEKMALRAGYAFVPTPVPDSTLDPANPDSKQHNIGIGLGYKKQKIVLDFFYIAGFYTERKVTNPILSGTYQNFTHYAGISVGRKF